MINEVVKAGKALFLLLAVIGLFYLGAYFIKHGTEAGNLLLEETGHGLILGVAVCLIVCLVAVCLAALKLLLCRVWQLMLFTSVAVPVGKQIAHPELSGALLLEYVAFWIALTATYWSLRLLIGKRGLQPGRWELEDKHSKWSVG